jgi:hypothetical protein
MRNPGLDPTLIAIGAGCRMTIEPVGVATSMKRSPESRFTRRFRLPWRQRALDRAIVEAQNVHAGLRSHAHASEPTRISRIRVSVHKRSPPVTGGSISRDPIIPELRPERTKQDREMLHPSDDSKADPR